MAGSGVQTSDGRNLNIDEQGKLRNQDGSLASAADNADIKNNYSGLTQSNGKWVDTASVDNNYKSYVNAGANAKANNMNNPGYNANVNPIGAYNSNIDYSTYAGANNGPANSAAWLTGTGAALVNGQWNQNTSGTNSPLYNLIANNQSSTQSSTTSPLYNVVANNQSSSTSSPLGTSFLNSSDSTQKNLGGIKDWLGSMSTDQLSKSNQDLYNYLTSHPGTNTYDAVNAIYGQNNTTKPTTQSNSASTQSETDTINSMYDQQKLAAQTALKAAIEAAKNPYQQTIANAPAQYQPLRDQASAAGAQNMQNLREMLANNGQQGGVNRTEETQVNSATENNINSLNQQQQKVIDDANNAINQLTAQGEYQKAQLVYDNASQKLQALLTQQNQDREYGLQQAQLTGKLGNQDTIALQALNQQKSNDAFNQAVTAAGLTGTYNGSPTQQSLLNTANINSVNAQTTYQNLVNAGYPAQQAAQLALIAAQTASTNAGTANTQAQTAYQNLINAGYPAEQAAKIAQMTASTANTQAQTQQTNTSMNQQSQTQTNNTNLATLYSQIATMSPTQALNYITTNSNTIIPSIGADNYNALIANLQAGSTAATTASNQADQSKQYAKYDAYVKSMTPSQAIDFMTTDSTDLINMMGADNFAKLIDSTSTRLNTITDAATKQKYAVALQNLKSQTTLQNTQIKEQNKSKSSGTSKSKEMTQAQIGNAKEKIANDYYKQYGVRPSTAQINQIYDSLYGGSSSSSSGSGTSKESGSPYFN